MKLRLLGHRFMVSASAIVMLATAAGADLTLTGNTFINASGELRYTATGNALVLTKTSGAGTLADPFVFDVAGNFNVGTYTIYGSPQAYSLWNNREQYSAKWVVTGNVTGTGYFKSHTTSNGSNGGHVLIEANGSISAGEIFSRNAANQSIYAGGDVALWAKSGSVTVTFITARGTYRSGSVVIRSEGPVAGQGITITGTATGGGDSIPYSILTESKQGSTSGSYGGKVSLFCEGGISLAGGISTRAGDDNNVLQADAADVLIRGSYADPSLRAGDVEIRGVGGIRTDPWDSYPPNGSIKVFARSFKVSTLNANSNPSNVSGITKSMGDIDIDVTENVIVTGYITARTTRTSGTVQTSPAFIKIVGRRIAVLGKDADNCSIRTYPANGYGDVYGAVAGDGDITLTGTDSSTQRYDAANPTNSLTSSIYVAGKIEGGRKSNDAMGNIRVSAVEVQLRDNVTLVQSTAASVMAIRCGIMTKGIVTHLVENNVRWNGTAAHEISYTMGTGGLGTLSFTADVPYAGQLTENGTVILIQ